LALRAAGKGLRLPGAAKPDARTPLTFGQLAAPPGMCPRLCVLRGAWTLGAMAALISLGLHAQEVLPDAIARALARAKIPPAAASFFAAPVAGPAPILLSNADRPMNPASTMKLVTTYAALQLLGPSYTWKTPISAGGTLSGDVLHGNLYIKGVGDPDLVLQDFWLMLGQVRARGIREIAGDVVIDRSLFQASDFDAAQFDGEPYRPYNVGPDAFLVNFKAITLYFIPDELTRSVRVVAVPSLAAQTLGAVRYVDGPCGDWQARLNPDFSNPDAIAFVGGYPGSCGEKHLAVSVYSHAHYSAALFKAFWKELGGSLDGQVRDGPIAPEAWPVFEQESPSLGEIVRDINKYSNNVMAKELFLDLSAETPHLPASAERSQRVVMDFLAGRGLPMPELVMDNGSGLSRVARISALSMGRLLIDAFQSPVMPEFVASLPLVGFDGTMRRRLSDTPEAGRGHIKTGTLVDTHALAGYVLAASGTRYAIVSFINHPNAPLAQSVQDAFLQWVYEHG